MIEEVNREEKNTGELEEVIELILELENIVRTKVPDGKDVHDFLQHVAAVRAGIQMIQKYGWTQERVDYVSRAIRRLKIFIAKGVVPEDEIASGLEEIKE